MNPNFQIEYFDLSLKTHNPIWNFFTNSQYSFIYCISLHECTKRRSRVQKYVFDKLGIPVNWFLTERHPRGPKYGCHYSHQQVMADAYNKGAEHVLIFEDDVHISSRFSWCNLKKSISFMKENTGSWEFFMFSANYKPFWRFTTYLNNPNIVNALAPGGAAYVIPRRNMKSLKEFEYYDMPYDLITEACMSKYIVYPTLFQPYFVDSTLNNNPFNFLGCFSRSIHLFLEWYAVKINIPWLHWFVLFLVILIVYLLIQTNKTKN